MKHYNNEGVKSSSGREKTSKQEIGDNAIDFIKAN